MKLLLSQFFLNLTFFGIFATDVGGNRIKAGGNEDRGISEDKWAES